MKYFVIGDVHGCYDELMLLFKKLKKEAGLIPEKDILVFLGDYIDRGPKSSKVIKQMIIWEKKYPHWQFLYGNHEDLMLDALLYKGRVYHSYDLWWGQGGRETFLSYVSKKLTQYEKSILQVNQVILPEHLKWLADRPIYFENKEYFFVHAGIPSHTSLEEFKNKVDKNIDDMRYIAIWIRDEFINSIKPWGKKIIFGHTAIEPFGPIIQKNKIGIDCAVCPPTLNALCAVELPSEKFFFQKSLTLKS